MHKRNSKKKRFAELSSEEKKNFLNKRKVAKTLPIEVSNVSKEKRETNIVRARSATTNKNRNREETLHTPCASIREWKSIEEREKYTFPNGTGVDRVVLFTKDDFSKRTEGIPSVIFSMLCMYDCFCIIHQTVLSAFNFWQANPTCCSKNKHAETTIAELISFLEQSGLTYYRCIEDGETQLLLYFTFSPEYSHTAHATPVELMERLVHDKFIPEYTHIDIGLYRRMRNPGFGNFDVTKMIQATPNDVRDMQKLKSAKEEYNVYYDSRVIGGRSTLVKNKRMTSEEALISETHEMNLKRLDAWACRRLRILIRVRLENHTLRGDSDERLVESVNMFKDNPDAAITIVDFKYIVVDDD